MNAPATSISTLQHSTALANNVALTFPITKSETNETIFMQQMLMKYGDNPNAYFHFQDDVLIHMLSDVGFISYFHHESFFGSVNIIFCDPVCHAKDLQLLYESFFREVSGKMLFMGLNKNSAEALVHFGYQVNHIGLEFTQKLQDFSIKGRKMRTLKRARNFDQRGFLVLEQTWDEVDQDRVKDISRSWRKTKATSHKELKLLTRPPEFDDAWQVRKFYCYYHGQLAGFIFFDPFFRDGKVIGYTANILRCDPTIEPSGFLDFVMIKAMEKFKQEGIEFVSLGLSPFHAIEPLAQERTSIRFMLQCFYQYGNFIYAFKKLAYHKQRYHFDARPSYAALKDISTARSIAICIKALNVI